MQRDVQLEERNVLQFLAERIDYERAATIPYTHRDFRLDRMRRLLARLGNPHDALKIVHVAGTKGKGSTAAMIASMLGAAGFRTGLYSSPHLDGVEERLMIGGAVCPRAELFDLVERVRPVVAAMDAEPCVEEGLTNRPTYFEIVTAMAMLRFAERQVDAAVLEVGLGGRLDSTNVCDPRVTVITSISFDHTQHLGETLAKIAGEKAGIIKSRRPVVSGVLADEPRTVIAEVARRQEAPLTQLARDFDFSYTPPRNLETAAEFGRVDFSQRGEDACFELRNLELPLAGAHQAANAAVAIATLAQLRRQGWDIPEAAIRRGLADVRWPARIEVLRRKPTIILDAAHNVASAEALVRVLAESFQARRRLLVFATTRDKDLEGILRVLLPSFNQVIFTRYGNNPRAVPPEELDSLAARLSPLPRRISPDSRGAWLAAQELAGADDLICITGSFFIAAEMRALVSPQPITGSP